MASLFDLIDRDFFLRKLQEPLWYRDIVPEFKRLREKTEPLKDEEKSKIKDELYQFFEDLYKADKIFFGNEEGIWDTERKEIKKIIIHHTSQKPGMTPERLSAIEIIRLYAPFYFSPVNDGGIAKDKPISSGHIRNGKQVFWPYHWIVREDGTSERLLNDNEVGWQAGNWEVNCESIAIVFDDDLENKEPTEAQIKGAAEIIRNNYPRVLAENVLGHMEVNPESVSPSKLFLGENGWKKKLLKIL